MNYPVVEVRFHENSKFPIDILTNDGQVGLTIEEAEHLIADLIKAVGNAIKEVYAKEAV